MIALIGLILTVLWAGASLWYLRTNVGFDNLFMMLPGELGDIVTGVVAPLFFIWLVAGYFHQGRELRRSTQALLNQTAELRRNGDNAKRQARTIASHEMHARRDSFFRFAELLTQELLSVAQKVVATVDDETIRDTLVKRFTAGDKSVFYNRIMSHAKRGGPERLVGEIERESGATALLTRYCTTFETLLEDADACDEDEKLCGIYEHSPMGDVYALFCQILSRQPVFEPRDAADAAA